MKVNSIVDWSDKEIIILDNEGFCFRSTEVEEVQESIIEHADYQDEGIIWEHGFEFWVKELPDHAKHSLNELLELYQNFHEKFKQWG